MLTLARVADRVTAEGTLARKWRDELVALAPEERLRRIRRATRRFRGRAFAEILLESARACLPGDPEASCQWARAAHEAILCSPLEESVAAPLRAQARALLGNGRRALGDLAGAEAHLTAARALLPAGAGADPLEQAELDALEGVLRKDQRRFREARELLERAILLYRAAGAETEAARELIALSTVYSLEGEPEEAITVAFQAVSSLDPGDHPDLYLFSRYNLAFYLHSAGRHQESVEVLTYDADLYERCRDPALTVRVRWLQGRLAAALGDREEAGEAFREVRAYFQLAGHASSFAAVCLDLALLHLEAGRPRELAEAAAEAVAYFRSQGLNREVLAALLLVEEAAREHQVTARQIRRLIRRLESACVAPPRRPDELC